MKNLNEATIEEFRLIYNFTIDQMLDMLKISESSYEGIKDEPVVCYSYRPEIKEIFIARVEKDLKVRWIKLTKKAEGLDEDSLECLYNLVESFVNKKTKKTKKALV
ncbi:hypothetical protein [Bacillus thuringiensis]